MSEIATHSDVLALLSRMARDGRTQAAIALERALPNAPDPDFDVDAELERLTREAGEENPANQDS